MIKAGRFQKFLKILILVFQSIHTELIRELWTIASPTSKPGIHSMLDSLNFCLDVIDVDAFNRQQSTH